MRALNSFDGLNLFSRIISDCSHPDPLLPVVLDFVIPPPPRPTCLLNIQAPQTVSCAANGDCFKSPPLFLIRVVRTIYTGKLPQEGRMVLA